ncbi:MAG: helix-turn-helix transcriptional regulator [Phycisphaerae bacterium]|nr:helix-turn-helix transcriptional regulator [Phycisphaerae bacterium]
MAKQAQRKIRRTRGHQQEIEAIRERLRRERPSLRKLRASGDVPEVVRQGEYVDLLAMLAALKKHREAKGLSLADVSKRCGMDRSAISRLENGAYLNPTLDTLYRYAGAIGAEIALTVRVS